MLKGFISARYRVKCPVITIMPTISPPREIRLNTGIRQMLREVWEQIKVQGMSGPFLVLKPHHTQCSAYLPPHHLPSAPATLA